MAKQDEWKRTTLRLPPDLHQRITDAVGANSLNAEIVATLENKYPAPTPARSISDLIHELRESMDAAENPEAYAAAKKSLHSMVKALEELGYPAINGPANPDPAPDPIILRNRGRKET